MNPCYKCTERTEDCHSLCELYNEFVRENEDRKYRDWVKRQARRYSIHHENAVGGKKRK